MWDKVRKRIVDACDVMDMVMAAVVVIGIVIAVIGIFPQIGELWRHREETVAFLEFLDAVLGVVIGVEFLKMLCKPNTANIIEALIFVIARHMIVQTTKLSADGPIKPPYAVYFQGGLTWYHAKLGILMSLQKLVDAGIVTL